MKKITVDPEFKSNIPPLSDEEYAQLEKNILADGCRDPLVLWGQLLVDGHNRYAICTKHGLPFDTVQKEFASRDEAMDWMDANQLGRRNLTPDQSSIIRGRRYNRTKKAQGGQSGNKNAAENEVDKVSTSFPTAETLADQYGVSERTIRRDGKRAEAIERLAVTAPEKAQAVLDGKKRFSKVLHEIKRDKREAIKIEQNKQVEIRATVTLAQCTQWLDTQQPCDLLLTDPPYSTDIEDIEAFACTWLPVALAKVKPTGRAYVFIGPYPNELLAYLTVAKSITNMTLENILVWTYRNTLGPTPKHKYKNNWQACLYFIGKDAPPLDCPEMVEQFSVQDISAPDGRQGDRYHEWQKPIEIAERFVRHSTKPGDLVLDPFAGTGTHLLAAAKLGRVAHGCDINQSMLDIAIKRGCKNACVANRRQRVGV